MDKISHGVRANLLISWSVSAITANVEKECSWKWRGREGWPASWISSIKVSSVAMKWNGYWLMAVSVIGGESKAPEMWYVLNGTSSSVLWSRMLWGTCISTVVPCD